MNPSTHPMTRRVRDAAEGLYLRWIVARAFKAPHLGRFRDLLRSIAALGGGIALLPALLLICIVLALFVSVAERGLERM